MERCFPNTPSFPHGRRWTSRRARRTTWCSSTETRSRHTLRSGSSWSGSECHWRKMMETNDPVLVALFGKLDHQRQVVKTNERFIQEAAEHLQKCNVRKRTAEAEVEKLTEYLTKNFPNWEADFDEWQSPKNVLLESQS